MVGWMLLLLQFGLLIMMEMFFVGAFVAPACDSSSRHCWRGMVPPVTPPEATESNENESHGGLEHILQQFPEFRTRLIALPIHHPDSTRKRRRRRVAEIYVAGQCVFAQIVAVLRGGAPYSEPKLQVRPLSSWNERWHEPFFSKDTPLSETMVIDIGQVITIWEHPVDTTDSTDVSKINRVNDAAMTELILDQLHRSRSSSSFSQKYLSTKNQGITKQQLYELVQKRCRTVHERERAQIVLRNIQKAGVGYTRLVDSSVLAPLLFPPNGKSHSSATNDATEDAIPQRRWAAQILASDAQKGGRFKRWPCMYVPSSSQEKKKNEEEEEEHILLINGGWLITDPSIRTGTEARKFAERAAHHTRTGADERIRQRLECLAMGELIMNVFKDNTTDKQQQADSTPRKLELDVREVLRTMNLPLSPDGAKQALVRTGYWSADASKQENLGRVIQPWSETILDAAKWYATATQKRNGMTQPTSGIENLTSLPCVSVDASKATFRDDAMGLRLRAQTGRTVLPEASQWEILIHVADVSDIYAHPPDESPEIPPNVSSILRQAAAGRGSSRYDLPLGPLHLLPPVVLQALAFSKDRICRSVSIWAYIDERNGALLDFGIERTLISPPIHLSFAEATSLLDGNRSSDPTKDHVQALLLVAERNLKLWDEHRIRKDESARKREIRLSKRESSSVHRSIVGVRDDGVDGFRRSRGHRLVDSTLNLYSNVATKLLSERKAPCPRAIGADVSRGGRVGTAPLRRYIDGQIQRQLLAVLCNYGQPMDMAECKEVSKTANQANNSIKNIRSIQTK